jgi:hypothetical protein
VREELKRLPAFATLRLATFLASLRRGTSLRVRATRWFTKPKLAEEVAERIRKRAKAGGGGGSRTEKIDFS